MSEFPPIQGDKILLRAILHKSDYIKNGEIQWLAFYPTKQDKQEGISLIFEKKDAWLFFARPIYGYISVHNYNLCNIPGCNLDIIQDKEKHASIMGIPYFIDEPDLTKRKKMKFRAQQICRKIVETKSAVWVDEFQPEGFMPEVPPKTFVSRNFLILMILILILILLSIFFFLLK